jgi:hypothetical protein
VLRLETLSKEARDVLPGPPPRTTALPAPTTVPLDQLWDQIPLPVRTELITCLTRMVAQRLASLEQEEQTGE